ncbi:hypothetical protein [Flavobacterium reichenbachii]|uniref:hypothetical protein n=1 Tax=Flavobacterium reichenbachii TaxID=362418 RepID=UPI00068BAF9F|nr:hypothetical protein [Flavobacterium reichenbachii]OXB10379.1 hypothetical protein B0A68_22595 [Flavobacterium reichenbachii]
MKKTALTFGLFSLVVVATSFASPVTTNGVTTIDSIYGDGASTGNVGGRKLDVYGDGASTGNVGGRKLDVFGDGASTGNVGGRKLDFQAVGLSQVSQSQGLSKKLD